MTERTRMTACVHLHAEAKIEAASHLGNDWLVIEDVALWCESPEQAEEIARAAIDLARRMRERAGLPEPDALARVHRALDDLDALASDEESPADEYARSQATGTLAH